ncbi:MAG: glucose dehydrogenase [Acidobacteria bacterium]|nr:MAG: glucose dehydrogenase [Acidobacteriota bacterium]
MKALAIYPAERDIRIIQVPEPRLDAADSVLIHPIEVGICGTDRDIVRFELGAPPPGLDYLVMGHETIGEVVEVGRGVEGLRKGDLVVPTVRRPCSEPGCIPCRIEQSDMCFTGRFTERGIRAESGYMTELIVERPRFLARVPPTLRGVAVMVEPLTLTEKALAELVQIQARLPWGCPPEAGAGEYGCRSALVLGAGPIGFLAALALSDMGFRTHLVSRNDPGDPKVAVLGKLGITYFSSKDKSPSEVAAAIGNIDVILEAAGSSELAFEYLPALGVNGIYLMTGVPGPGNRVAIDTDLAMRRLVLNNQAVVGVVNANIRAFRSAVERLGHFARKYPDALQSFITARVPLEAFSQHLLAKQRGEIKTVLTL